ncbi:hypothetical protein GCM10023079_46730 [Streptomyces chitinivorans]
MGTRFECASTQEAARGTVGSCVTRSTGGGEGNCATRRASDGGSYNLPENTTIGFVFCRYKAGAESECSGYEYYNDN